VIIYSGF